MPTSVLAIDPLLNGELLWTPILLVLFKVIVIFAIGLVGTMFMVWYERKVVSGMQNRVGPNKAGPFGLLQTLADGMKLIFKEDLLPTRADRIVFRIAPFLAFVPAFLVWSVIPLGGDFSNGKDGTVEWFGHTTLVQLADPADGHPRRARPVVDRRLRHHARRLVERVEVPAARLGPGVGADDLLRSRTRAQRRRRAADVGHAVDIGHRAGPGRHPELERDPDRHRAVRDLRDRRHGRTQPAAVRPRRGRAGTRRRLQHRVLRPSASPCSSLPSS